MKKSLLFFFGIALTAMLAVSCNDISGTGSVKDSDLNPEGTVVFSFGVESITPTRNIMPDDWTASTANNLVYVLTGDTTDGSQSNQVPTASDANKFTYEAITGNNAKIALKPTTWYLTLTAYQDSDCTQVALKSGITEVNLTGGNVSKNFTMTAPEAADTTATGSADVTIQFPKSDNFASVTYGIYTGNLTTSAAATDATVNDATKTLDADGITKVNETGTYSITYTNAAIKAGSYYFNAIFYDNAETPKIIGFYSDIIVIDGANTSSKTITLGDIFNKPATNPTTLSVAYSYNNNGMNAVSLASGDTVPSTYKATFTWDDKSDNETGYELVLTNADDAEDVKTYTSSSTISAGSFGASSTTATVELETGKEYTAKIRSVNSFTNTVSYYEGMTDKVNLFTVAYNLVSGKVKTSSTSDTSDTVVKYVVPYNKSSSAQTILNADSSSYPYVYRTSYNFVKWYLTSDTDNMDAVTEIAADNYENIELTAYWESSLGVTVTLPTYQTTEDLALVSSQSEGSTVTIAGAPVSPATSTVVTLTPNSGLTLADVTWTVYDTDFTTVITDNIVVASDTKVLTWTITAPAVADDPETEEVETADAVAVPAGTYRVAVTGTQTSTGAAVSGNVYIKITR